MNKLDFESDEIKAYVQQLQSENGILRQNNDEKNELLIKLGYPTTATAKRKVFTLEQQLKRKEQECEMLKEGLNLILTVQKNCKECPHQKLDVDVLVCDLDCATAFKKIAKQTLKKLENKNV